MEYGGHFTFGQKIDKDKWRHNFRRIADCVEKIGDVVVACHDSKEFALANEVVPDFKTYLVPNNYIEFMKFYSKARFGIVNRVHSAFMLASFGKPATIIGNDSRALMANNLKLPSYYVENVEDAEEVVSNVFELEKIYHETSSVIREAAKKQYISLLTNILM
jgi:polysaccharide pyruvyl transferase WcaK-like protein